MYSGDEFYGDDITSGVFDGDDVDPFDADGFRAFCDVPGCTWSSDICSNDTEAMARLTTHSLSAHGHKPKPATFAVERLSDLV